MASVKKREWTHKGQARSAWVVRYKDAGGAHRSRQFDKKKDADAFRVKTEAELAKGLHIARGATLTVAELAEEFIHLAQQRHRDGRRMGHSYLQHITIFLRRHVVPKLGARHLTELTWQEVDDWMQGLLRSGLSAYSARRVLQTFRMAMDHAERRGYVHFNVVRRVKQEYGHVGGETIRTFTKADVQRLLTALDRPSRQAPRAVAFIRAAIYLAAFCGLRRGEILGLTAASVNMQAGVLHIRNSLNGFGVFKPPKTRSGVRDVPMPDSVAQALKAWMPFYVENENGCLFRTKTGGEIDGNTFHVAYWKPVLKRAGFEADAEGKWHHFHALRHFAASMMIEHHVSLPNVAAVLGHKTFDMTLQVYAHTVAGGSHRLEALDAIACELLPAPTPPIVAQGLRITG